MSKLTKALTAAAGNAGGDNLYVEDVFSTYLYTGNSSTNSIDNGIDLDGEGGLVWIKERGDAYDHSLYDTERSSNNRLVTNSTAAEVTNYPMNLNSTNAFTSTGFDLYQATGSLNYNGFNYASWTFRKAEKFFDVVTYTGNGSATNNVSHGLGDVPGFIVVKRTDGTGNWCVAAGDSSGNYKQLTLNNSGQSYVSTAKSNIADSSIFNAGYLGVNFDGSANTSGGSYVAYLFASDAGGFGDDGSESIIKCGSYDANLNEVVDLGFEPQFIIYKSTADAAWRMADTMRGWTANDTNTIKQLFPNLSNAESDNTFARPTPTGFIINQSLGGQKHIYIAIRRPMKTPESGTEVFSVSDSMSGAVQPAFNAPHVVDMAFQRRPAFTQDTHIASRLTGIANLYTNTTAAEVNQVENVWDFMDGWGGWTVTNTDYRAWNFKRATGFFDVVAYTGTGSATHNINHNLTVLPEMMIVKRRDSASNGDWYVYHKDKGYDKFAFLNDGSVGFFGGTTIYNAEPTSTVFTVGSNAGTNASGSTYIWYGFATTAGVSKVGSYTGTGSNVDVDCGFSAGARFILIKRSNDGVGGAGDWYVWDSARGIVAGNDPYLLLNSTAAEVTSTDYIDPLASGFTVTSSAPAALNASGGTYIFLAIA